MILLAFDTASVRCDACVYDGAVERVLGEARLELGKGHAEHLIAVIDEALKNAAKEYNDLDAIAVTVGPGSFTGVRVGVSAARGFALSLGIPAIGITTLEGLAVEAIPLKPGQSVLAAIDARRDEVYAQRFDAEGNPVSEPQVMTAYEATNDLPKNTTVAGSGANLLAAQLAASAEIVLPDRSSPDVKTIARLAASRMPPHPKPSPLYLRKPDAKPQAGFEVERTGS